MFAKMFLFLCIPLGLLEAVYGSIISPRLAQQVFADRSATRQDSNGNPLITFHEFKQRTNHFTNDPHYGPPPLNTTFIQRYYFNDTFYKPGGPIIVLNGGETDSASRLESFNTGIVSQLAYATNGLAVVLEHRYYGQSFPVNDLSTDNLRWLTLEQSVADIAYFAQHAVFPGHEHEDLTAPKTPWILQGGSLAGAQTTFAVQQYGHIIYGGIASSGTVKTQLTYPEWYYPIQKYAPQDCIKSIEDIVDKLDYLAATGNEKALLELKTIFGLASLKDIRDFAMTIALPIGNPYDYKGPTWQELSWDPTLLARGGDTFIRFCDTITSTSSTMDTQAVDSALSHYTNGEKWKNLGNYAKWIKEEIVSLCPDGQDLNSIECFGTSDQEYYANASMDYSGRRSWLYQVCSEFGGYTQGAPIDRPSLLSRVIQADYTQRWCNWSFPPGEVSSIPSQPDIHRINRYGALSIEADRLARVDGARDAWIYLCVGSPDIAPKNNTLLRPFYVIEEGGHHWDQNGLGPKSISAEPGFIRKIHEYEIEFVKSWLAGFTEWIPGQ